MPSIYLTTGQLVNVGPGNSPYGSNKGAQADADDRNKRAKALGIKARYEVGPDAKK